MKEKEFVWGVATAAYQIEGAAYEEGRGESIWDVFSHEKGRIRHNDNGDVACDHYHRYKEDVALIKELGVGAYRFSLSWSRILPEGTGKVNPKGLAFYHNLIDELSANGIRPYITLYHWDLPQKLFEKGGWLSPESPEWFYEYAALVGKEFGEKVKHFITINEPQCVLGAMNGWGHAPGGTYALKDRLTATHNLLKAHGKAVTALRKTVPDVQIGFAPCSHVYLPKDNSAEAIEAAKKRYFALSADDPTNTVTLWSDPVVLGDYPKEYYELFADSMPDIRKEDMQLISQPIDFYCQNIYTGSTFSETKNGGFVPTEYAGGFPRTQIGWNIVPDALYWGPKFLCERYKLPLYITENGMANPDVVSLDGQVHDPQRIDFTERYLRALKRAKQEGANVCGYFHWSLLDNFEWSLGYDMRFGLVYVDYETLRRIPKDSFRYYAARIKSGL